MPVRTFTMPGSLNESLASSQSPTSNPASSPPNGHDQKPHAGAKHEPLPSNKSDIKSGITFAAQDKLPRLPIPDLQSTCNKYIEALKPLQSHREQRETAAAVREFLENEGPELNERLKKYATGKTSYIEQFCRLLILSTAVWKGSSI